MNARRTLRRVRRELDQLEAFAGLLEGMPAPRRDPSLPDMVEVSPGVWARLQSHEPRPDLLSRMRNALDLADELEKRSRDLGRGGACRSRSK